MMIKHFKPALILFALLTLLTGVMYPLLVTGLAQILFPYQANGSLEVNSHSSLIGQPFSRPEYFWGRPSATAPFPYNAGASSGSNLGPTNPALLEAIKARIDALKAVDPTNESAVPIDLITASGSGLDPEISIAAANYQAVRIAKARHLDVQVVQALIAEHTQQRTWQLLGEPRVNVLMLNHALDAIR
jgi:K+-transporting ATPase ATPase C chain